MRKGFILLLACCIGSPAVAGEAGGYLFVTFRGEATPMTEQVYFMLSDDGYHWEAVNGGDPVLVSTLGERGVRDPYIMRSHDDTKFYLIATDLSINLDPDWGRAQTAGSQSIVVWESGDLVHWSAPRLVKVAPDDAGCTWAPEAVYDEESDTYMVFWASKTAGDDYTKQRIWAARTTDFREFSDPFIYIDKPHTVIDTTIIRQGDTYFRFTKDEEFKAITMERSKHLMSGWTDVADFSLKRLVGYEGPSIFMTETPAACKSAEWHLLLDFYSEGKGYQTFTTDDLGSGSFAEAAPMDFPFHPVRHGSVLTLTPDEYDRLEAADENRSFEVEK